MQLHHLPYILYNKVLTLLKNHRISSLLKRNDVFYSTYSISGIPIIETHLETPFRIYIGSNIKMNNGLSSNQIGYCTPCVLRSDGGNIVIGDNVGMSQTTIIAKDADVVIGSNTLLGGGVKIYSTDFHSLDYFHRRDWNVDKFNRKSQSVKIGNDCFIGAGVIILKGVTIGDRTIVAAGSVVTKSIPNDCIAGGNPAKIIRNLFA